MQRQFDPVTSTGATATGSGGKAKVSAKAAAAAALEALGVVEASKQGDKLLVDQAAAVAALGANAARRSVETQSQCEICGGHDPDCPYRYSKNR